MDTTTIVTAILMLAAGIGVFLVACMMLSNNLESICSSRLKALFAKASDKKLVGVGIGTVTTAAIQSSGATSVLVIGFVNAGIMSLTLATAIIYGANIGTTVTAQIVALGMFGSDSISFTAIFSALAGVGAFIYAYAKNDKTKKIGGIVAGFGMLFVGLDLMSNSMADFAQSEAVISFLSNIDNLILLIIIGVLLTALVQSSSVVTSIAIVMLVQGLISLEQGIYITMGSNIGSCIVAILAAMSSGLNAKRVAAIHLSFNVFGVILFTIVGFIMTAITSGGCTFGTLFASMFPNAPQTQLAMFHTIFNVITVIIMLPLTSHLIAFVTKLLPDKKVEVAVEEGEPHMYFINEYMLKTPAIAVMEVKNEMINMSKLAIENFNYACDVICTMDNCDYKMFRAKEKELNYLKKNIPRFIVKLSNTELSKKDSVYVSTVYRTVTDLERIGDYSKNIVGYAEKMKISSDEFSDYAKGEIRNVQKLIDSLYERVLKAYTDQDYDALDEAYQIEDQIDDATDKMADSHIRRISEGVCSTSAGAEFLSLTSDAERVADHFINMGKTIKELKR
jgi:phosphate:Na+ symporter